MLSNNDFSQLIKSGKDLGAGNGDGKARFDLKTIKQWDKQIKTQQNRRGPNNKAKNIFGDGEEEQEEAPALSSKKKGFLPAGYRDRAEERRKGVLTEEDANLEAIAADESLSKFLGGDEEHTHLVKGLDYALLERVRHQQRQATEEEGSDYEDVDEAIKEQEEIKHDTKKKEIEIVTPLGQSLYKLLLAPKPPIESSSTSQEFYSTNHKEAFIRVDTTRRDEKPTFGVQLPTGNMKMSRDSLTHMYRKLSRAGQLLSRTVYEVDLRQDAIESVPGSIVRSARESIDHTDSVNYSLPKALASQLAASCDENGQLKPRVKRRRESAALPPGVSADAVRNPHALHQAAPSTFPSKPAAPPSSGSKGGGLYDDIIGEDVGRYDGSQVPSGSSHGMASTTSASVGGIFSQKKAAFGPARAPVQGTTAIESTTTNLKDLARGLRPGDQALQPLKGLLAAEATRTIESTKANSAASSKPAAPPQKVIFRDVFATTSSQIVERGASEIEGSKKTGVAFGLTGAYDDIFPETSGQYDMVSVCCHP